MPSRKIHRMIDRIILGKDYDWLHKLIDYPSVFLGPKHRILFHSPRDPIITYLLTNDLDAALSHYLHILTDKAVTKAKKKKKQEIDLLIKIIEKLL